MGNLRIVCIGLILLAAGVPARAQMGSAPFVQDPLADGLITFEAENYHSMIVTNGRSWVPVTNGNFSGGLAMQVLPNTGANFNVLFGLTAPRLDYRIQFNRTGPHVITIRGVGITGSDDSVHAGFDNAYVSTSDRIYGFDGTPRWSASTLDGPIAIVNVPSVGEHTVNVWMREDGFIIDKISVSANTNFLPQGLGPPESDHVGSTGTSSADPMSTFITSMVMTNGALQVGFTPVPDADTYSAGVGSNTTQLADGAWANGYALTLPLDNEAGKFVAVKATPVDSNYVAAVNALNRLAYGPTPDELLRVAAGPGAIGAAAFVAEQISPELLTETADADPQITTLANEIESIAADITDLQAWHLLRAVKAKRQLLETLMQFTDNHFTTYYWKSRWTIDAWGPTWDEAGYIAAELEYRELEKWRQVLLDPNGTFYDLLKISAESPAMLIYLDSITSVLGAPNENYSREIMELFCMGVDNGYDQSDIVAMAPAWTGWTVKRVQPIDASNPHATVNTNSAVLLPRASAGWSYRKGTSEPPVGWQNPGFVEGAEWLTGQAGIGYADGDDNTILADMSNGYTTVYFRKPFVVSNLAEVATLNLKMFIDDGAVVYLNGTEIVRSRAPSGNLTFTNRATSSSPEPTAWLNMTTTGAVSLLQQGTNILAIHGLNQSIRNTDFSMDAEILAPPVWSFVFDPATHETTNKTIFAGKKIHARFGPPYAGQPYQLVLPVRTGTNGIQDGYDIVAHLANLPYTQEYISMKLCRLFVSEEFEKGGYYNQTKLTPEEQLIKDCMTAWDTPGPDGRKGNIRAVLGTIFDSDLFRSRSALRQKVKTPMEYTVSAIRSLRADIGGGTFTASTDGYDLIDAMWYAGMELFAREFPDGWPENGRSWIDTGTINERLRFVENFLMQPSDPLKAVDYESWGVHNISDPVALLMNRLSGAQWTDPVAVTQYFLGIILPAEGWGNLDTDLDECVNLLNSDDTGTPGTSPFNALTPGTPAYDLRVRSLVGFLLSNPKIHEQ